MKMRILDLFSGIGGFSLGLERTGGFTTVAFCERDAYARAVLRKHWPDVPCFDDVRNVGAGSGLGAIDVVCGGFPCQDISFAGAGAGLGGERSGLWFEMLHVIAETRPRYVIAENVAALRSRGLETVLGGLASVGYDAEWHCSPASAVGAPHRRDRVWVVAYADRKRCEKLDASAEPGEPSRADRARHARITPDAMRQQHESRCAAYGRPGTQIVSRLEQSDAWAVEPGILRVAHGVPHRVDRLRCVGNAVVPQIPELLGRAILSHARRVAETETIG